MVKTLHNSKKTVTSTNYPGREPFEATFALSCKLQEFCRNNTTYASIDDIFRQNSCKFEKFVVPLQPQRF